VRGNSRLVCLDFFRPHFSGGWRMDPDKFATVASIRTKRGLPSAPLNQGQGMSVVSIDWLPCGWPQSVPAPVDLSDESIVEFCDHMLQVLEFVERNQRDGMRLTDCHKDDVIAISKICEAKQMPNVFEDLILKGREVSTLDVRIGLLKLKELFLQKPSPQTTPIDYVTLLQCAGIINKGKRTLERWKQIDTKFPTPEIIGETGGADEWSWATIRPYLEVKANRKLPEIFPAHVAL